MRGIKTTTHLTKAKKSKCITSVLAALYWLQVSVRIAFKLILLVFKSLNVSITQVLRLSTAEVLNTHIRT